MRRTTIRRRNRLFRRRRVGQVILKVFLWLLVIPAAIGGYFLARHLLDRPVERTPEPDPAVTATATLPVTAPTAPLPTAPPETDPGVEPPEPPAEEKSPLEGLRGIWLPAEALRDPDKWDGTLRAAAEGGITCGVVDLKDADGKLWYQSATDWAAAARGIQKKALTREELTAGAARLWEEYGIRVIPRLFAFRDNLAPRYLETARVGVQGNRSITWFDGDPNGGGRRWLNPYAPDARAYITGLAAELKEWGFSLLMLDGVQFPDRESKAWYGDPEQTALPRDRVLADFCREISAVFGDDNWILCSTPLAAVGEKTGVYGGNPLTFGAPGASPWARPADMGSRLRLAGEKVSSTGSHPYEASLLLFRQLAARLNLMDQPPLLLPWLDAEAAGAQIAALTECFGEGCGYILYQEKGKYAF